MLSGTVEPLDLDIHAIIAEEFSPAARSAMLAGVAREALADAEADNEASLGFVPDHITVVDGREGADEATVKPNGEIVYSFKLVSDVLGWIYDLLETFAPVRSGRFRTSIALYADGVPIDPRAEPPSAAEFVFESLVAYAGKIEGESAPPESPQAPNGVFEAVAALALQRFGAQVNIAFSYRQPIAAVSQRPTPAITITTGQ